MRRVFKTRQFAKWMRKTDLTDDALCLAVSEMVSGLVDADLGGDVLKNRLEGSPTGLYNNFIGQGVENKVIQTNLTASYMLKHNLFVDGSHTFRRRTAQNLDAPLSSNYLQLAIRWNFVRPDFNY